MRPKETYTKEEYIALERKYLELKKQYMQVDQELKRLQTYLSAVREYPERKAMEIINAHIDKERRTTEYNRTFIRHPYYKDIKDYVEGGVTDINMLMLFTGKSRSSVYRGLHDLGLMPLKKENKPTRRLNL